MASKEVVDRLKEGDAVSRAAEQHADAVGDRLGDMLQPFARKGDTVPDVGTAMALLGRRLQVIGEAMSAADRASEGGGPDKVEALAQKQAAIAAYDAALEDTATLVSVLLRAIGEDALAMQVQVTKRRPGRVTKAEG